MSNGVDGPQGWSKLFVEPGTPWPGFMNHVQVVAGTAAVAYRSLPARLSELIANAIRGSSATDVRRLRDGVSRSVSSAVTGDCLRASSYKRRNSLFSGATTSKVSGPDGAGSFRTGPSIKPERCPGDFSDSGQALPRRSVPDRCGTPGGSLLFRSTFVHLPPTWPG
jgi:hypothetical protein